MLSRPGGHFRRGLTAKNTHISDVHFLIKNPLEIVGKFYFNIFLYSLEKMGMEARDLL